MFRTCAVFYCETEVVTSIIFSGHFSGHFLGADPIFGVNRFIILFTLGLRPKIGAERLEDVGGAPAGCGRHGKGTAGTAGYGRHGRHGGRGGRVAHWWNYEPHNEERAHSDFGFKKQQPHSKGHSSLIVATMSLL